jgi:hypothetical protein
LRSVRDWKWALVAVGGGKKWIGRGGEPWAWGYDTEPTMRVALTLIVALGCSGSLDTETTPDPDSALTSSDSSTTSDDTAVAPAIDTGTAIETDSSMPATDSATPATDTMMMATDSMTVATDTKPTTDSMTAADTMTAADSGAVPAGSLFEQPHPWTKDVSASPKSTESDKIITGLQAAGGWGGGSFRVDYSIEVLRATSTTPFRTFTTTSDFYSPDCDKVPMPVPVGGALEGESGYACAGDGDCHLIVIDPGSSKLYEMWRANITSTAFYGGCLAVWDLKKKYPDTLRGKGCSSADAAGFPITAMLGSADEVAAGEIKHALRFILPNARIQDGMYVAPATHSTGPTAGGPNTPPYGVRFRLRSTFPVDSLASSGAKVVARALMKYGMFLADGGTIALTLQSDRFTKANWSSYAMDGSSLTALKVSDFEVVEMGPRTNWNADTDCYRTP